MTNELRPEPLVNDKIVTGKKKQKKQAKTVLSKGSLKKGKGGTTSTAGKSSSSKAHAGTYHRKGGRQKVKKLALF